jgi:DNA repair exonuclease SbcCD ATPase subunit
VLASLAPAAAEELTLLFARFARSLAPSLDDDSRKALKKLAKERKVLREKNEQLENQVVKMQQELEVGGGRPKAVDLETKVKMEDLAAEARGWKERCVEAMEHVERSRRELTIRKEEKNELESLLERLSEDKTNLAGQLSSAHQDLNESSSTQQMTNKAVEKKLQSLKQKLREKEMDELNLASKMKDLEAKLQQEGGYRKRTETHLAETKEALQQAEYANGPRFPHPLVAREINPHYRYSWGLEKKRLKEARSEIVNEKSTVEGRNEYLEREVSRLITELNEEMKKKEFAEREAARSVPLQVSRAGGERSGRARERSERACKERPGHSSGRP